MFYLSHIQIGLRNLFSISNEAIVQYPGKHSKNLATILLLLPTVLNSRVSNYSGHTPTSFSLHNKLLPKFSIQGNSRLEQE